MWQMIAAGAAGFAQGYFGSQLTNAVNKAENQIAKANAEASNKVRGGSNKFAAAKGSLQRYMQSLSNNQSLEAGGEALAANLVNARRQEDAALSGSFEDAIRSAEQTGAQAAAAAFAGVSGEVADTVSVATKLGQQRAIESANRFAGYRSYDHGKRSSAIFSQMVRSLDSSLIFDAVDANVDVAQKKAMLNPWAQGFMQAGDALVGSKTAFAAGGGGQSPLSNGASFFNSKGSGVTYGPATNGGYGGNSSTVGMSI
jgi:hypothetical protein